MTQYFEDDFDLSRSLPTWGLNAVAIAISTMCIFGDRPNYMPMIASAFMPWLALIIGHVSKGWFRIMEWNKPKRPNLCFMIIFPAAILGLLAIDLHIVDWSVVLLTALGVSGILTIAIGYVERSEIGSMSWLLAMWLIALPYGYGVAAFGNVWFDPSMGTTMTAKVLDKTMSQGRSAYYHLRLETYGPLKNLDKEKVPERFYREVNVGDQVCIRLHPGAFRAQWYEIEHCEP